MKDPPPSPLELSDAEEMVAIVDELKGIDDPDDREGLLLRLAEYGLRGHDFSDLSLCEHCHGVFAELQVAQQVYRMAALRVGRMLLGVAPEGHEVDDDADGADETDEAAKLN